MALDPEVLKAFRSHAEEHYEDGGWDVIVECWSDSEIQEHVAQYNAQTLPEVLAAFRDVVGVYADRQAEAAYQREMSA